MKISSEDLGDRQVMLTIEVDPDRVERALRGVARQLSRNYNIPGFRRGRAPYHVILQRFGRETLLQEALDDLGQEVIREALETQDLEPYDVGSLEDIQLDPLVLKLRVPLVPTVDLGDYREIRVNEPMAEVNEAEIAAELEQLRQSNAILEPIGDRPAKLGDWVSLDVNAELGDEELVQETAYEMVLDPEDKDFEVGFAEQVAGMQVDEEKQFSLILGNVWGDEKSGQEADFSVTLREIRDRTVPDLDDDLARTVGDFDTFEELRQDIYERIEERERLEADQTYAQDVLEALVAQATIEYPPELVEEQIDSMAEQLEQRMEGQGISLDDFFKLTGQTEDEYREGLRPEAESLVRRGLALGELTRQEQLDVEGDEVETRISLLSASWGERASQVRQMLSQPDSRRSIANSLLTDKAVQRMVAIAKGEAPSLEEVEQEAVVEADSGETETKAEAEPSDDAGVEEERVEPVAVEYESVEVDTDADAAASASDRVEAEPAEQTVDETQSSSVTEHEHQEAPPSEQDQE